MLIQKAENEGGMRRRDGSMAENVHNIQRLGVVLFPFYRNLKKSKTRSVTHPSNHSWTIFITLK